MNSLLYPILIPLLFGIVCVVLPKKMVVPKWVLALICTAGIFIFNFFLFFNKPMEYILNDKIILRLDNLSGFILLGSGLFGFLITLYSIKYMEGKGNYGIYYGAFLWTLGASHGVLLANHLLVLLLFWGFLGITLYLLVLTGGGEAAIAAKKTLIIVGGSDALMVLGIVVIYNLSSTFEMDKISLSFNSVLPYLAFFCLSLGAFAKAGAMPLHTWIPEVAEHAPVSVTAYLPAALDKLLGIYLLGRMCLHLFKMSWIPNLYLMATGAVTILAAVMMALIQHDLRRLLAYHAVSQVGYMVLGIGTGNPIGIAGGIFHMLNHSIYKACLFLCGGSVQHRTGTTDLNKLGGLGKFMPVTFFSFLIAAFAISGIPPFNGFFSKWMVYQGLVEVGKSGGYLWIVWLIAAMFGSALTLASFMKLTYSIFLGIPDKRIESRKIKEVNTLMIIPVVILASICVLFGIFAYSIPVQYFLIPSVPQFLYSGIWSPGLATVMIIIGIIIGLIIYMMGRILSVREAESFIGGEKLPVETRITGTGFYDTIRNIKGIRKIYAWANTKRFDVYDVSGAVIMGVTKFLRRAHSGILTSYMIWFVIGLSILLLILL